MAILTLEISTLEIRTHPSNCRLVCLRVSAPQLRPGGELLPPGECTHTRPPSAFHRCFWRRLHSIELFWPLLVLDCHTAKHPVAHMVPCRRWHPACLMLA